MFGPNTILLLYSCTQVTKSFRLSTILTTFWTKIKNTKFSGHIWAWAWHVAHLAQKSKNFAKSFPFRWGILANKYLKNNYPKQKSTTPPLYILTSLPRDLEHNYSKISQQIGQLLIVESRYH